MISIFDGHKDVLERLHQGDGARSFFMRGGDRHVDLSHIQAGGDVGGRSTQAGTGPASTLSGKESIYREIEPALVEARDFLGVYQQLRRRGVT